MGEDASIVVSVDDIKAFEKLKLISQIAPVKERIRSFERKYGSSLEAFENRLRQLPEDFERWDDFIEWKAYEDSLKNLESRLKKIEDATNFRIASG
jgi:predicted  nucleic acid-binding Zn-ribbon protein